MVLNPDRRTPPALLLAVLGVACVLRLLVAIGAPTVWDEDHDWIPVSRGISLRPGRIHVPIHEGQHPSLPAYFMRAGALLVGDSALGYRLSGAIAGLLTVALVYVCGRRWFAENGALAAAALVAINEYHVGISAFATEKPYYLLASCGAVHCFGEFLRNSTSRNAAWVGGTLAFGVMCKYLTLLLIPVFAVAMLVGRAGPRVDRRVLWVAVVVFAVLVAPDVLWTAFHPDTAGTNSANLGDHFRRIGGLGFSRQPLVFYLRDLRNAVYPVLGLSFGDPAAEYPTMNGLMGLALLGGVVFVTTEQLWRAMRRTRDDVAEPSDIAVSLLLLWFWVVFGFFLAIRPGTPKPGMDAVVWLWVDATLLPAVLLVGQRAAALRGVPRIVAAAVLGAAGLLALTNVAGVSGFWR